MLHAVLTKHWMYKKKDAVIYEIEKGISEHVQVKGGSTTCTDIDKTKGTELAEGLILVHERSDVFSLQPDAPMQLSGKLSPLTFD